MAKEISEKNKLFPFDLQNPRSVFLVCALLFVFVAWVFAPSLQGQFMFYDENSYLVTNPHVNSGLKWENIAWAFSSLEYSNWYPLTWLSHMLDVQIFGLNSWGHHLTNILLHALNTALVFLVFRKMTGAAWRSLVVALLFGLHPLRVESVAWISERKDVLSTMFWLLAMWTYAKFSEESKTKGGKTKLFYSLTLIFFVMGLMSKTMLVTLPLVFLLLDYWPLNRWEQKNRWSLVMEKVPLFLLTAIVSIVAYIAQQRSGTLQEMSSLPLSDRLGNAVISYVRYLGKFFWPENLCVYYPHPGHWPTIEVLAASLLLICISLFAFIQRRTKPYLFTGWFWYLGTLVPVIGLVQLESQSIADRYTYVPLIGFYVALVWGLCELTRQWRYQIAALSTLAVMATILCAAMTRHEINFWKDGITVWSRAIAVTKNNYVAHKNLGIMLQSPQPDAAIKEFQEAVRINPDFADAQRHLADLLSLRNLFSEAIVHYQKALAVEPDFGWAEYGLGHALYESGQTDEAIVHFQKAVVFEPQNDSAQYDLGVALLNKGRTDEAIVQLQNAVEHNPKNVKAHGALALFFYQHGRLDEAIIQFQAIVKCEPSAWTECNLATVLYEKGQVDEAIIHYQKALKYEPNNAMAQNGFGEALLKKGQVDEAINKFQEALKLQPDFARARSNLDSALKLKAQAMTQTNQPPQ